jgi:hypothetical protein
VRRGLGETPNPTYELQESDVKRALVTCFGRKWPVIEFIGCVLPSDVGKRVFRRGDVLQVENNEQRAKRLAAT